MAGRLIRFDWAVKKLLRSKANFGILDMEINIILTKEYFERRIKI